MPERSGDGREEGAPSREFLTEDKYRWFVYDTEVGLTMVGLEDLSTGIVMTTTITNPSIRAVSYSAWIAARRSRSLDTPWEVLSQIVAADVDPDERLHKMFVGYGHASVGDLGDGVMVDFFGCPMDLPCSMFYVNPVQSSQEGSTRFMGQYGEAALFSMRHFVSGWERIDPLLAEQLEREYFELGKISSEAFGLTQSEIAREFGSFYQPSNAREHKSLEARSFDVARFFLLFGNTTGFSLSMTARAWSRTISEFRSSSNPVYVRVADQLQRLLVPSEEEERRLEVLAQVPGLIRHTEKITHFHRNLRELREFVKGMNVNFVERFVEADWKGCVSQSVEMVDESEPRYSVGTHLAVNYLRAIWPGLKYREVLEWHDSLFDDQKGMISEIIFKGHNHHENLPPLAATSTFGFHVHGSLGEMRDWNRHRAWNRVSDLPLVFGLPVDYFTVSQILAKGYGLPLYLTEIDEFCDVRDKVVERFDLYYEKLFAFVERCKDVFGENADFSFVINLLPLAHRTDLLLYGNPMQANYLTKLRVRFGGHINYRVIAYMMAVLVSRDPPLRGLALGESRKPNVRSREEFFDRS